MRVAWWSYSLKTISAFRVPDLNFDHSTFNVQRGDRETAERCFGLYV